MKEKYKDRLILLVLVVLFFIAICSCYFKINSNTCDTCGDCGISQNFDARCYLCHIFVILSVLVIVLYTVRYLIDGGF